MPMPCLALSTLCNTKPSRFKSALCHAFPSHIETSQCLSHSTPVLFRRLAALRRAMPVPYASKPLHCHFLAMQCCSISSLCLCQSMLCRRISLLSFAAPCVAVHGLAFASLPSAVLCHCVAFPELRKTKPGRSFALPRLLGAHPCPCISFPSRGYTKPKLFVALPICASASPIYAVPKLWIASLCLSTAGQRLAKQCLSFALLIPSPALASYSVPLRYAAELYCADAQQIQAMPLLILAKLCLRESFPCHLLFVKCPSVILVDVFQSSATWSYYHENDCQSTIY